MRVLRRGVSYLQLRRDGDTGGASCRTAGMCHLFRKRTNHKCRVWLGLDVSLLRGKTRHVGLSHWKVHGAALPSSFSG